MGFLHLAEHVKTMFADRRGHRGQWRLASWILLLLAVAPAGAQEATPFPPYTGDRVYVRDVPDQYQALGALIKKLERSSPQSYFVVVVKSAGTGDQAAARYVDGLHDAWQSEARRKGLKLDPDRAVIVLLASGNRKVAVHTGVALRGLGLDKAAVNDLIDREFIPKARAGDYPGAASSLLVSMNNTLARRDRSTASYAIDAPAVVASTPPAATALKGPASSNRPTRIGTARTSVPATSSTPTQIVASLAASAVAIGLIIAGLIWLARRRTRGAVERKIKDYKRQAVDLMDRLDALKKRLETLPVEDLDFKEPMAGATLAFYEQLKADVTRLWDRWLEVMDVLDKAESLAGRNSALGQQKLKEAEKLVSNPRTFEEIDGETKACAAGMDRLNNAHEEARKAAEAVIAGRAAVQGVLDQVRALELPVEPYQPELDAIARGTDEGQSVLTPDPLGAKATLDQALARIKALRTRLEQIVQHFEDAQKLSSDLRALGERVAGQRSQGLRLDEDGGNPDEPMGQTFQSLEKLRKALHEGDPAAAAGQLQSGQSTLKQAQGILDSVLAARASSEKDQAARARETQRLREAMSQYDAFEAELERDFAPGSWQVVAGNLPQARALLETFDRKVAEATQAASAQKYLLAARLLAQLGIEQQAVFQLMTGVSDQLQALRSLREECRRGLHELEDEEHAISREFDQNAQAVGSMARQSLDAARESRQQVAGVMRQNRPDWTRVRQLLSRAFEDYAIARNQAATDARLYQELRREYERVRQDAARVGSFLSGHQEDRMAANQHYHAAEDALSRLERESASNSGEWARLLEQVRSASADLEHAERLAREDIRLAQQAEMELREASQTLQRTRGYFAMGLTPPMAQAEDQISRAHHLYQTQDYEQAIRLAGSAIQQIREAHHAAVQQALWQQMQTEAEQRRRAAATGFAVGMGAAAAGAAAGRHLQAASPAAEIEAFQPPAEAPPTTEPESSTASGDWSGESTERAW
jgi:hypothetical protein